ncbi:glycosyltransferase [Aquitalea sp. LB_tupeE]|uniref:GumK N-terminal domain-containing glycosyltransferase n=1 Tax=Aquitalea sp. LB_tupeE TaxID=2748078 RepID=UPI0015BEA9AC|nr:glycosyltransferase [Aquitalea sp. LB_tupeE]NWK79443.1 glycosyltransferase [Aquitalea sp. LB_tupeE]
MPSSSFLMISRHDYRSKRKANVHFIAEEMAKLGPTRFFSSSFSHLAKLKKDQRLVLWNRANQVENIDGVDCYLWKTLLHPVRSSPLLEPAMNLFFKLYLASAPEIFKQWVCESSVIILESGGPEIFFPLIKKLNPSVKVIYICSDPLWAINTPAFAVRALQRDYPSYDGIRIPSRILKSEFPLSDKVHFIPHGIEKQALATDKGSPYKAGKNIVSVGNMLFDPGFFQIAAPAFPDVQFHIIGGGPRAEALSEFPNVTVYGEMPFADTLPYIKYADAGVAPYQADMVAPYLTDTSMKLMQYGFYGLPAICPTVVEGGKSLRFGYEPDDAASIKNAVSNGLSAKHVGDENILTWSEVLLRILNPDEFSDTAL